MFVMKHITIASYHIINNGQAEQFVNTFKTVLKISNSGFTEAALQRFLQVIIYSNNNAPSAMTLAEIIFARKIRSVFDKLIPNKKKSRIYGPPPKKKTGNKFYEVSERVFLPNASGGGKILGSWNYSQKNRQDDIFSQRTENSVQNAL